MSSKAKKKNLIMNIIMVAAIVLIATAGVLTVGSLKGWFDKPAPVSTDGKAPALTIEVSGKIGSANIYRDGYAYSLKDGTLLRDGDTVETLGRSSLSLNYAGSVITLGEDTRLTYHQGEEPAFTLENGRVFNDIRTATALQVQAYTLTVQDAVFTVSVPFGSADAGVLSGSVRCGDVVAEAGEQLSLLDETVGGCSKNTLLLQTMDSFELDRLVLVEEGRGCIFTPEDVAQLKAQREAERQAALAAILLEEEEEARIDAMREEAASGSSASGSSGSSGSTSSGSSGSSGSVDLSTYCTIEIRCDTILSNMGSLAEGKDAYVPANGIVLAASKLKFTEGETVFDVLKRACSLTNIQLEYSWTPLYNSYYVEGINHLYEFDCGDESGWMYKVNGWFPNYGCSSYKLKDGDVIVWCYTCNGLGADVGGAAW